MLEQQIKRTQGIIERLAKVSREICGRINIGDKELADMGIHHDSVTFNTLYTFFRKDVMLYGICTWGSVSVRSSDVA
jgi:hypothetical protein